MIDFCALKTKKATGGEKGNTSDSNLYGKRSLVDKTYGVLENHLSLKKQRSISIKKDRPPKEDGLCDFLLIDSISKKTSADFLCEIGTFYIFSKSDETYL